MACLGVVILMVPIYEGDEQSSITTYYFATFSTYLSIIIFFNWTGIETLWTHCIIIKCYGNHLRNVGTMYYE